MPYRVRIRGHLDFCLTSFTRACVLLGLLGTGLPDFGDSLSRLLGACLFCPHVCSSLHCRLWRAMGSPWSSWHPPGAHCYLLWKRPAGPPAPLRSDSCGLLWFLSLTQHLPCSMIHLNSSSFTLFFGELQRIFVNRLNSANNCPHVVGDTWCPPNST